MSPPGHIITRAFQICQCSCFDVWELELNEQIYMISNSWVMSKIRDQPKYVVYEEHVEGGETTRHPAVTPVHYWHVKLYH